MDEPALKMARMDGATPDTMSTHTDWRAQLQEALLLLSAVISPSEVKDAVSKAIQTLITSGRDVTLHWEQSEQTTTQTSGTVAHLTNGWLKSANLYRSRQIFRPDELGQPDVRDFFKNPTENKYGVILPVVDQENASFHSVISFTCDLLNDEEIRNLDLIEKQIQIMFQRLHRLRQHSSTRSNACPACSGSTVLNLCSELYDQDAGMLQIKVIRYLKKKTGAAFGIIFFLSRDNNELFFQVKNDQPLQEEVRFRVQQSLFENAIKNTTALWLKDFPETMSADLNKLVGSDITVNSLLCVPIVSKNSKSVIAVTCMLNKEEEKDFSEDDVNIIRECFQYAGPVLTSSVNFQTERRMKVQTQTMLEVAMNIFRKLDDLTVLLREIMLEAKSLTNAERCSVFLLEADSNELVAKVFDGLPTASDRSDQPVEIRIPATQGIAGYVATKGEMLNIIDAYSHPLFYRGVDEETGFRTRNILCFPIKDENEKIVGVAQLCNKITGTHFTSYDEDIAKAFSVYCCISIVHSLMYKKVQDAQHRNKLANELMTYHMQVSEERVHWLTTCSIPGVTEFKPDFANFNSIPRTIDELDSILATVSMFEDLGFIHRWRIPRNTLARFVLMVKRGYRDPPYHNWAHAFSVGHFVYLCARNLPLDKHLSELELFALFVASLCHDIDHRGTNNSFQVASQSVLAALYSSEGSVLERHHFSQTICILNTEACNIFENLSRPDYYRVLDLIRDIILATDLAHHLHIIKNLSTMAQVGYNPDSAEHHNLLLCMLMTSADLSDQTKHWENTRSVAELIYKEFFSQGDLEKALGQKPAEQMDRERACVPDLQISFLDNIATPCYKILTNLYGNCSCMIENIERNRANWTKLSQLVHEEKISGKSDQIFRYDLAELIASCE